MKSLKKITALLTAIVMIISFAPTVFAGAGYTVEDAYEECAALYPDFVDRVTSQGATEKQIITFLKSVQEYLLDMNVEITEDNFEDCLIEAVNVAVTLRKNVTVRNALVAAFPEAVVDGSEGVIHEDFEPIVETIKLIIFEHDMLEEEDDNSDKEDNKSEEEEKPTDEATEAPTEEVTEPQTEEASDNATEPDADKPTDEATEPSTDEPANEATTPSEYTPELPTSNQGGPVEGGEDGVVDDGEDVTVVDPTEPVEEEIVFKDMDQAVWAEEAVKALVGMGIVSGYPDGTFLPNKSITRAEFAKIIVLASGRYNKDAKCTFTDVSENQWYYSYVASAYELGFINGRSETIFDPESQITRADLCTIAYRFIKSINSEFKATDEAAFKDAESIPSYAKEAVNALYGAGIVGGMGDNKFEPLSQATRAQSAKIIYGAIKAALGI